MSMQTYEQAIEQVLSAEMSARPEMILLRAGAYPTLAGDEREIFLPRGLEESVVNLAVGAALAGAYPVLDLRDIDQAALPLALMELPVDVQPDMTILAGTGEREALMAQSGLRCFAPQNPRQAAGFARAALRSGGMCLLLADEALYDMEDEVPDDGHFMLIPPEAAIEEEADAPDAAQDDAQDAPSAAQPEEACWLDEGAVQTLPPQEAGQEEAQEGQDAECAVETAGETEPEGEDEVEEPALQQEPAEAPRAEPIPHAPEAPQLAARSMPFDGAALTALEEQLAAPRQVLIRLLMDRLQETERSFEWCCEAEALPGECAFLPPEKESALLWLGADRLTLTYDVKKLPQERAALLLRAARRLMETPALLIYDRERDRI